MVKHKAAGNFFFFLFRPFLRKYKQLTGWIHISELIERTNQNCTHTSATCLKENHESCKDGLHSGPRASVVSSVRSPELR